MWLQKHCNSHVQLILFAYHTTSQDAKPIARDMNKILTKHTNLATTTVSDDSLPFVAQMVTQYQTFVDLPYNMPRPKIRRRLESSKEHRPHFKKYQRLKIETSKRRCMWYKYVNIAVLNQNTSYHSSIGCEPSRIFHGRVPYNVFDLKMDVRPQKPLMPISQITQRKHLTAAAVYHYMADLTGL